MTATIPRGCARSRFLDSAGWGAAAVLPLAGDASNRRYFRLSLGAARAILMDAPPERGEDVRPFIAVTDLLRALGLSAPEILAREPGAGFLLLEDLGDAVFARLCATGGDDAALYGPAVDLLAELSRPGNAHLPDRALPGYNSARLAEEAQLAVAWYLAGTGAGPGPVDAARHALTERLGPALEPVWEATPALTLRDYHAENLIWLPERQGIARVGLLDYQDAVIGHPAYDLVSLLEDARRDTAPELRRAMIPRFLARRPELDPESFSAAYAALGAQRNLKIIGIFARLARRDGKPRYLAMIPRVWGHLMGDLAHPGLGALSAWVAATLPAPDSTVLARLAEMEPAQ